MPFGVVLAEKLHEAVPGAETEAMKALMDNLFAFYCFMGEHAEFDPRDIATCTRRACLQYGALRGLADARGEDVWRPKPKLHMWQEMAEYQAASLGNPRHF